MLSRIALVDDFSKASSPDAPIANKDVLQFLKTFLNTVVRLIKERMDDTFPRRRPISLTERGKAVAGLLKQIENTSAI